MNIVKLVMRCLLAVLFIAAGLNHFRDPDFYVHIMPPYLPWHREFVYLSGVCEIVLGVLLLMPRFTVLAAWGLIALLIAVFPANVHMAWHAEDFSEFAPVVLWARLPIQLLLIAWAFWFTRHKKSGSIQR